MTPTAELHTARRSMDLKDFRYFDILVHLFVVVLMISNLIGAKICAIGPFRISGAQILFPLTYIFGDIFTEVYGYAGSRRAIWMGFIASGLLAVMGLVIVALPPAPDWANQTAFEVVFFQVPRMIVASLIAFWAGEFSNSFVMAKLKVITRGRALWVRTIGSTAVGQLVDTTIIMVVAFWGTSSQSSIPNLIFSGYVGKVLYEAAATPLTYLVVNRLKRAEGVDVYDDGTNFNPFASAAVPQAERVAVGD